MERADSHMSNSETKNNVYARTIQHDVIHISEAASGRKGYYCMGCDREMQAVHSKYENRISYFRHDAQDVKNKGKCTYSDETYRHKLAKEILQRIKTVKVPAVYKFPAKGIDGKAYLLSPSKLVQANRVENELYFYEDDNGEIKWSKTVSFKAEHLLFRPDVAFFNSDDKPILLIELVATHKVSMDKFIKMKRIGIDAIEILIPKTSPEEIELNFSVVEKTKWLHNNEEADTEYIPNAERNSAAVPPVDEDQGKLFEEDATCRSAEIGNLIRSINRCLESKQYTDVRDKLELEIQRVETNTDRDRGRLLDIRDHHRKRVEENLRPQTEQYQDEEREFQSGVANLEGRYIKKKGEYQSEDSRITKEDRRITEEIEEAERTIRIYGLSVVEGRNEIDRSEGRIRADIEKEQRRARSLGQYRKQLTDEEERFERSLAGDEVEARRKYDEISGGIRESIGSINRRRDGLPEKYNRIEKAIPGEFGYFEESASSNNKRIGRQLGERIEEAKTRQKELPEKFRRKEIELRDEHDEIRRQITESINDRSHKGSARFSRKLETLVGDLRLLKDLSRLHREVERIREAKEAIDSTSYKTWL